MNFIKGDHSRLFSFVGDDVETDHKQLLMCVEVHG